MHAAKRIAAALSLAVALGAGSYATASLLAAKLPKCSGKLCHGSCSTDVLCASGTTVKTCAEVCGGNQEPVFVFRLAVKTPLGWDTAISEAGPLASPVTNRTLKPVMSSNANSSPCSGTRVYCGCRGTLSVSAVPLTMGPPLGSWAVLR